MSDHYLNFDLLIARSRESYRATVISSPEGHISATFNAPFTEQEVEQFLAELDPLSNSAPAQEAIKQFGNRLFKEVFSRDIYALWERGIDQSKEHKGLRLRLWLTDAAELARLPWEYLFDEKQDRFLALSVKTPVIRYLEVTRPPQPLPVQGALQVLVMVCSPEDCSVALDVDQELNNLKEALKDLIESRRVILHELRGKNANLFALQRLLQDKEIHVFHFIGHGGFDDEQGGYLLLQGEEGNGERVYGEVLKEFLGDQGLLRLVVLNACEGARNSLNDPFTGIAQSLFKVSVPAVVAMRSIITDKAAIAFSGAFYQAISAYFPVDAALAEARKAMRAKGSYSEWATPSLYMSSLDGRLFDNVKKTCPSQDHYENMIEGLMGGEVVIFLGPGANLCGLDHPPDDSELATSLRNGASVEQGADWGLPRLSQYIETTRTKELLYSEIHATLNNGSNPNPLHRFLARLPSLLRDRGSSSPYQLIVSGNYDDALERAFDQTLDGAGEAYDLVCYNSEEKPAGKFCLTPSGGRRKVVSRGKLEKSCSAKNNTVILKIHGAIDRGDPRRDSYVVTEDNYIAFPSCKEIEQIMPVHLFDKLGHSDFLFLGWRLADWNYRVILHRLWQNQSRRSWAILSCAGDRQFWDRRNVRLLDLRLEDYVAEMTARLEKPS